MAASVRLSAALVTATILVILLVTLVSGLVVPFTRPTIKVQFSAPPGTLVTQLKNEGQRFHLIPGTPSDDYFKLTEDGKLLTKKWLRDLLDQSLVVNVRHILGDRSWKEQINVRIVGVPKDTKLYFADAVYEGFITENNPLGEPVKGLSGLKVVVPSYAQGMSIRYELLGQGSESFLTSVSQEDSTVEVYTNTMLHLADREIYNLTLEADVNEEIATTKVQILVLGLHAPVFVFPIFVYSIMENSPPGTEAGSVYATDEDKLANGRVSYRLVEPSVYFTIVNETGLVMVSKPPPAGDYNMQVIALDAGTPRQESAPVPLTITAVSRSSGKIPYGNDMVFPPNYKPSKRQRRAALPEERISFLEDTAINSVIYTVADVNDTDRFAFKAPVNPLFAVNETTSEVSLVGMLNFEDKTQQVFELEITSTTNTAKRDTQVVVVEVENVEEPPKWDIIVYPYIQVVPVDAPSGASIYQLKASDPEGTTVNFFLNSGGNGMFTVNEKTGWIKTKLSSGQEYEQDKEYILSVYAEDRNGSRVNGEVTIFGGSHPPQFTKPRYQAKVVEETDASQRVVDVSAFSFNNNAGITYSILNNNDVNSRVPLHSIDANTGIITLTQRVDREELDSYFLNVQATEVGVGDNPMSTVVRIDVEVTDINDCEPEFDRYTFTFKGILETIDTNTLIGTVGASDCDIDPNNILVYSLTGGDASDFRITNSGELFANTRLDCDVIDCIKQFKVKLEGQEKMVDVFVYLTDVNDEPPVFLNADGYVYYVDENAASGYKIGTVYANDADKKSTIVFGIQGTTTFQIDPSTGVITRVGSGNLPEASYLFNVTATDNGNEHTAYAEVSVQVNDINDNVPKFPDCQMYQPNITEAAAVDTFLIKVTATDADKGKNAEIKYGIVGANVPFRIDQDTGEIFTEDPLDREDQPTIDIVVKATDQPINSYSNTEFCLFTVTINDVNDNKPEFPLETYYVNLNKSAGLLDVFLTVKAEDADESNQDLVYTLGALNGAPFAMTNGEIYPIRSLVEDSGKTFVFEVKAEDGVNEGASTVRVSITTGVAKPPDWTGVFPVVTVKESAEILHVVQEVSVVPGDEVVVITVVTGQIPETNSENRFRAKSTGTTNSADVEVSGKLDYETTPRYELELQAQYSSNLLSKFQTLTVLVEDENDEAPLFPLQSLFVASPEEEDPDFQVVFVQAQDADTPNTAYSTITYSLDQSFKDAANFTINPTTGEIISKIKFDREVKAVYNLQVKAEDGAPSILPELNGQPNSDTMRVTINVVDINDNSPVFAETLYTRTIPEDISVGSEVIRVRATDVDSDSNPRYLITANNTAGVFDVGPTTGRISIASPLDYETQREYWLQYTANDGLNVATTTIHIQLTNVNDEKPIFKQPVYTANVVEEDATNLPRQLVQVEAEDGDADAVQSGIKYSLEGTGAAEEFTINADDGWISLNKKLDREERPVWILLVKATDDVGNGLTGYAELEVTVIDINDNNPYFPDSEYRGFVPENSNAGTEVVWTPAPVKAIDLDDPLTNGRITYSTVTGSGIENDGATLFSIDGSTGRVTVKQRVTLDRETQDTYTLRIRAEDNDGGSAEIDTIIQLLDTNDNPPTFIGDPYNASVRETEPVGSTVFEVPVSDADVGFRNEVQLSITGGNVDNLFEIVPDSVTLIGIIKILNPLDYETMSGPYRLTLQVTDGVNAVSTTTIEIMVVDVNDMAPRFTLQPYEVTISEDLAVRSLVYTVMATDGEAGEFGRFTFSIDPASDPDGLYTISDPIGSGASRTGEVRIAKELDRETVEVQELIIRATDQGEPPLTGTATLKVTLEDVNDTPPRFAQDYKPLIKENKPTVQFVVIVSAVDPDTSGGPPFYLQVVETSDTGNFTWVDVDPGVNRLSISTKAISFDREEQAVYTIPIRMTDLYPNGNTGISDLIVEVEDVNDNPHKGVEKEMLVYSFEGNIPNSPIGFVGVEDPDTIEDKTYTPKDNLPKEYFTVNSDTGEVTILAGTPAGKYKFSVIVDDGGVFDDQESTITVDVRNIPEEAVRSSGSFRFNGVTAEQLIAKPAGGGLSKLDVLKSILAEIIPAKPENIDIFSVINVPRVENQVDVRYSAHGSPFYPPERMDGAALENRERIAKELGVTIGMIKIDMCLLESACESSCTNELEIDSMPTVVDSPSASFTSITTRTVARCVCGANVRQPGLCDFDACLNGGTCMETQGGGHTCNCPSGFDGPNCEQTTREFKAGFAHFGTLQQCEKTHTSLEFITTLPRGVLLYNGPMTPLEGDLPQDFMLIQLLDDGRPKLDIDLGSGILSLTINSTDDLGKGEWHRLDVYRNGKDVEFMLDRCKEATVAETSSSTAIRQTDQCKSTGQTPGDNKFLNINTPLQLGGIDKATAFTYPSLITFEDSFDGCMKNVDQDGTIYDLQTPGKVSGSTAGCSRLKCGECNDGKCVGGFNSYVCLCNPGFTGTTCNMETPAYDFVTDSYVRYQLKDATQIYYSRVANYQVMFRTREKEGLLWTITNRNGLEFTTIELFNGFIRCRWNLGDAEYSMYLDMYAVDDGDWHTVHLDRYDNAVTVRIDGGGGVRQMSNRDSTHSTLDVDRNSLMLGAFVVRVVEISQDFEGCMNDPRINNFYLGFSGTTEYGVAVASNGVTEGCSSHNPCASNPCPAPFVCIDLWRKFSCGCAPGFIEQGGSCVNIDDCNPNPCLNGGECVDLVDGFKCNCVDNFSGDTCGTRRGAYYNPLSLGVGAILAMILCLLLIILMLLAFVFYKRGQDRKQALAFAIDPDDDIRENFINYDEEGGGEGDQDNYDVSTLRKPIHPVPMNDYIKPPVRDAPLSRAPRMPGDDPNVGDFINDRLKDADDDPDKYPNDSTKEYDFEGDGSSAGSLSSLNSSSTDGDQNYDYLNDWGPPFKKLADMYGGGEDD